MSTISPTSPKKLDLSKVHEKTEKQKSTKEKHGENIQGARKTMDGALTTESGGRKHKSKTHRSKDDKASVGVSPRLRHEKEKRRTVAVGDFARGEGRSPRSGPPGGVSVLLPSSPPNSPRTAPSSSQSTNKVEKSVIQGSEASVWDGKAPASPRGTDFFTRRTQRVPANTTGVVRSETSPTIPLHMRPSEIGSYMQVAQNVELVRGMAALKEATPEVLEETLKQQTAHYEELSAKKKKLTHKLKKIVEALTDTASTMEAIKQEQKERRKSPQASPGRSGQLFWGGDTLDELDATLEGLKLSAEKQ